MACRRFAEVFLLVLALVLLAWVTKLYYDPAYVSSCGISQKDYMIFGVPRSLVVFFVVIGMLASLKVGNRLIFRVLGWGTLAFGLYLTVSALLTNGFLCKYCEGVKAILAILLFSDAVSAWKKSP